MSSEWPVLPLEDCLDALIDYRGKTPEKTSSGIPLITAKVIKNGRIEKPSEFIAIDDYDLWMRRGIPKMGDVVMTTEAPLGEVAQLSGEKIALAQRVITLRGKSGLLNSSYLLYLLQTSEMQEQLKSRATGTTVLGIKQSELRKVTLKIPPLSLQKDAASILSVLDKKIDLLRETNTTLEAIAQTLFKSWFVDFDPVKAKAQGKQPEGMDEATAALFPSEFEESALGLIPKGWRVKSLDEIAHYLNGLALQKYPPEDNDWLPVIKIAQLRKGDTVGADRANRRMKPEYIIQDGDMLFSWSGSLEVEIWCGGEGALNQHLFKVTSQKYPKWFYYFWTKHHLVSFQ
ncbi:MAG: restriction endonuclease subunit S, partial [Pseudomonadales bacterium]|nr:restriction endonuclease subunit S [Pseudomonadales bacterium]